MLDDIGEARLKDSTGDGFKWSAEAEVGSFPVLFFSPFEKVERFWFGGAEADAAVGAEDFDEPGVGGAGSKTFHFETQWDFFAVDIGPGVEVGIVPSVAGSGAAFSIGSQGIAFLKLGEESGRFPSKAQRKVASVHAEVVENAAFAASRVEAFPVGCFGGIEIAAVMEAGDDFEDATDFTGASNFEGTLCSGEERHFRTAAHEATALVNFFDNAVCGRKIDAEGLFGEEIFAGVQDVEVDFLVEIVRNGGVDDIDLRVGEECVVVGDFLRAARNDVKPGQDVGIQIGDRDEDWLNRDLGEGAPAGEGARHFAAHEAASDNADVDCFHGELNHLQSGLDAGVIVDHRHESLRDAARIGVLDDIATVDDSGGSLLEETLGAFENFAVTDTATATNEDGNAAGGFDDFVVEAHVVGGIGLDDVCPEFDGLADKVGNLGKVAINHVTSGPGIGLENEGLDHHGHTVVVGLWLEFENVLHALLVHFRSAWDLEEIDADASGVETHGLKHGFLDDETEAGGGEFLSVDVGHISSEDEAGLEASANFLEVLGLSNGQLDRVGFGVNESLDDLGHAFDALEESRLIEEAVINRDIETAVGLGVEKAIEAILFHVELTVNFLEVFHGGLGDLGGRWVVAEDFDRNPTLIVHCAEGLGDRLMIDLAHTGAEEVGVVGVEVCDVFVEVADDVGHVIVNFLA